MLEFAYVILSKSWKRVARQLFVNSKDIAIKLRVSEISSLSIEDNSPIMILAISPPYFDGKSQKLSALDALIRISHGSDNSI